MAQIVSFSHVLVPNALRHEAHIQELNPNVTYCKKQFRISYTVVSISLPFSFQNTDQSTKVSFYRTVFA